MRQRTYELWKKVVLTAVSTLLMAVILFPFYWMIMTSIKPPSQVVTSPPILVTTEPTIQAYDAVLTQTAMGRYLANSAIIAGSAMAITLFLGVFAGYGLARFRMRGLGLFLALLLAFQLLPNVSLVLPLFIIFGKLGFLDRYISVILGNVGMWMPLVILILRPYFQSIPRSFEDQARIDGCSFAGALARIVVPLAIPGIIAAGILSFLLSWGEFVFALTFISSSEMQPVTIGIYNAIGQYGIRYDQLMASSVIAIVPVILVFIFFQRYIRVGLTVGGMKE